MLLSRKKVNTLSGNNAFYCWFFAHALTVSASTEHARNKLRCGNRTEDRVWGGAWINLRIYEQRKRTNWGKNWWVWSVIHPNHAVIRCYSVSIYVRGSLRSFFDPNHGVIRKRKGVTIFVFSLIHPIPHFILSRKRSGIVWGKDREGNRTNWGTPFT